MTDFMTDQKFLFNFFHRVLFPDRKTQLTIFYIKVSCFHLLMNYENVLFSKEFRNSIFSVFHHIIKLPYPIRFVKKKMHFFESFFCLNSHHILKLTHPITFVNKNLFFKSLILKEKKIIFFLTYISIYGSLII